MLRNSGAVQGCTGNDHGRRGLDLNQQRAVLVVHARSDHDRPWPARMNGRRSSVESYAHASNVACRYELRLQITQDAWLQMVAADLAPQEPPFDVEITEAAERVGRR